VAYYHVILERYTAPFTEAEQKEIDETYERMRREVTGCLGYHRGPNVSPFAKGYTHMHISIGATKADHDAYQKHPLHDRLVEIMVPKMEASVGDLNVIEA